MENTVIGSISSDKTDQNNRFNKFKDSVNGLSIAEAKDFIESAFRRIQNRTIIKIEIDKLDF